MPYMLEGGRKVFDTRGEAEEAARRACRESRAPVAILETSKVALCEGRPTGVRHMIIQSSELSRDWGAAMRKVREATYSVSIKEM